VTSLRQLFHHRRRPEPALDVGLPAERTAMAWQRTSLALAGFSALVVHLADRNIVAAVPGVAGLVVALLILAFSERRYAWTVRRVEAGETPLDHRLNLVVTVGLVLLSLSSLVLVVMLHI
jgi:putative membrane protein